tara:strand:+ start:6147 stop:6323 length:177 start_codon:yes stop_codon:yes gene_type:complete
MEDTSSLTLLLVFILGFLFSKFLPDICGYVQNPSGFNSLEGFTLGADNTIDRRSGCSR